MGDYSSLLFARPTFLEGAGRLLDFGNFMTEYNTSPNGEEADRRALTADWCAISDDLQQVMKAQSVEKLPATKKTGKRSCRS